MGQTGGVTSQKRSYFPQKRKAIPIDTKRGKPGCEKHAYKGRRKDNVGRRRDVSSKPLGINIKLSRPSDWLDRKKTAPESISRRRPE